MKTAWLAAVFASGLAGAAHAGPTEVVDSAVLKATASSTVAVAPSAPLTRSARDALVEGLRSAGYRVVAADQKPELLVSWRGNVSPATSPYFMPQRSIRDNYHRDVTVVAWRADAPGPDADSTAWWTLLHSDGLSNRPADYLPSMLREGGRGYGQAVNRH